MLKSFRTGEPSRSCGADGAAPSIALMEGFALSKPFWLAISRRSTRPRKTHFQVAHKLARKILIQKQFHATARQRRFSRSAANDRHAAISLSPSFQAIAKEVRREAWAQDKFLIMLKNTFIFTQTYLFRHIYLQQEHAKRFSHPLRSSREDRKECGTIRIPEYRTANIAAVSGSNTKRGVSDWLNEAP